MTGQAENSGTTADGRKASQSSVAQTSTTLDEAIPDPQPRPRTPDSEDVDKLHPLATSAAQPENPEVATEQATQDSRRESTPVVNPTPEQPLDPILKDQDTTTIDAEPDTITPEASSPLIQDNNGDEIDDAPSALSSMPVVSSNKSPLIDIRDVVDTAPLDQEPQPASSSIEIPSDKHQDVSNNASQNQSSEAIVPPKESPLAVTEHVGEPLPLILHPEPVLPLEENLPVKNEDNVPLAPLSGLDSSSDESLIDKDEDAATIPSSSDPITLPGQFPSDDAEHAMDISRQSPPPEVQSPQEENASDDVDNITLQAEPASVAESAPAAVPVLVPVVTPAIDTKEDPGMPVLVAIPAAAVLPVETVSQHSPNVDNSPSLETIPEVVTPPEDDTTPDEAKRVSLTPRSALTCGPVMPLEDDSNTKIEDAPHVSSSSPAEMVALPLEQPPKQAEQDVVNFPHDNDAQNSISPDFKPSLPEEENVIQEPQPVPESIPEQITPPIEKLMSENKEDFGTPTLAQSPETAVTQVANPSEESDQTSEVPQPGSTSQIGQPAATDDANEVRDVTPVSESVSDPEPAGPSVEKPTNESQKASDVSTTMLLPKSVVSSAGSSSEKSEEAPSGAFSDPVSDVAAPVSNENIDSVKDTSPETIPTPVADTSHTEMPAAESRKVSNISTSVPPVDEAVPTTESLPSPVEAQAQAQFVQQDSVPEIASLPGQGLPSSTKDAATGTPLSTVSAPAAIPVEISTTDVPNITCTPSPVAPVDSAAAEVEDSSQTTGNALCDIATIPALESATEPIVQHEVQPDVKKQSHLADLENAALNEPTVPEQARQQAPTHRPSDPLSTAPSLLGAPAIASTVSLSLPPVPQSSPRLPTAIDETAEPLEAVANAPRSIGSIAQTVTNPLPAIVPVTVLPELDPTIPINGTLLDQTSRRRRIVRRARELLARRRVLVLLLGYELGNATHAQLRHTTNVAAQIPVQV